MKFCRDVCKYIDDVIFKGFIIELDGSIENMNADGNNTAVQKGQQHDCGKTLTEFDQTWTMAHDLWKRICIQD